MELGLVYIYNLNSGGTISGCAKYLKENIPGIKVIGVDPRGSILALPETLNEQGLNVGYQVEGIGYDFIPNVLDREIVDEWMKSEDKESFLMARELIRVEGLLCGGSSGTAVAAAIKAAKTLKKGQRCVVLLPDSVRNYMTKFLRYAVVYLNGFFSDDWMKANGFTDEVVEKREEKKRLQWGGATIATLDLPVAVSVSKSLACKEAVEIMQAKGFDQLPVTGADDKLVGMLTLGHALSKIASGRASAADTVGSVMWKFTNGQGGSEVDYVEITSATLLEGLSGFFETNSAAVVTSEGSVKHVATKVDLLAYLMKHQIKIE